MNKLFLVVITYVDMVEKHYCTSKDLIKTIEKYKKDKNVECIEYGETSTKSSNSYAINFKPNTRVLAYEKEV